MQPLNLAALGLWGEATPQRRVPSEPALIAVFTRVSMLLVTKCGNTTLTSNTRELQRLMVSMIARLLERNHGMVDQGQLDDSLKVW